MGDHRVRFRFSGPFPSLHIWTPWLCISVCCLLPWQPQVLLLSPCVTPLVSLQPRGRFQPHPCQCGHGGRGAGVQRGGLPPLPGHFISLPDGSWQGEEGAWLQAAHMGGRPLGLLLGG